MKNFLIITTLIITLVSCGGDNRQQFESAGGSLYLALDEAPTQNNPAEITDIYSQTVYGQIYESLVSINPEDLKLVPQLAKKWTHNADFTEFSFELRENVMFHECELLSTDEQRTLTVNDVVASIENACKPNEKGEEGSAYVSLFADELIGAEAFFKGKSKSIKGLEVKGNKIAFRLIAPDPSYAEKLAQINAAIRSKIILESDKKEELIIGTGPFMFPKKLEADINKFTLAKNPDYYMNDDKGNALPYLDSVVFTVETRKLEQLEKFENGELHLISGLPTSRISDMLEGHMEDFNANPPKMILYNNALLNTHYYFFNMTEDRFKNPKVRQAFNYAIDRNKITQQVLKGQYYENGIFGIVPPIAKVFKGYDFTSVREVSYDYDPAKAKALLAEAGYPNGNGFGSVTLRLNIGDVNSAVADEISEQLYQNLGIILNLDATSFELKDKDADFAKGGIFRTSWNADYASPESFLNNFYGKYVPNSLDKPSSVNQSRYVNSNFDVLIEKARSSRNQKEQYKYFMEAEVELMKDPPLIALWYANDYQLLLTKVRNLKLNPMRILDLRKVYLKEWTKEEYTKTLK